MVFDRLGRTHAPPSLVARVADTPDGPDLDALAARIREHARPYLLSQDYAVHLEMTGDRRTGIGYIVCGVRPGGTFHLRKLNNDSPHPAETAQEPTQ